MKNSALAAALLACLSTASAASAACDESGLKTYGELDAALSTKAVEAITLASAPGGAGESRLQHLIAPSAPFALGAGDVGNPLGEGIVGARALARAMNADSFRYFAWSGIPTPVSDPCGKREVQVEFVNSGSHNAFPLTFQFESGHIVSVRGWTQWIVTGPIRRTRD